MKDAQFEKYHLEDWEIWSFSRATDTVTITNEKGFEEVITRDLTDALYGNTDREKKYIRINEMLTAERAITTLIHELHHAGNPKPSNHEEYIEQEIEAREASERFAIEHGLAETQRGYRTESGDVNEEAIREDVERSRHYNPPRNERRERNYEERSRGKFGSP
jgi:hypothetical protein